MPYAIDPDFQTCVRELFTELGVPPDQPTPRFPRGDVPARRTGASFAKVVLALEPDAPDVVKTEYTAPAEDGFQIPIIAYRKASREKLSDLEPVVLYLHGGGMIFGSAELFEPATKTDVAATGITHFSVNYRVAPEVRHPTPIEDCYSAFFWLHTHAEELGVDNSRICVTGLSAGGGLAAALCLLARDRGITPPIAKQILECPMLDDRNLEPDSALLPFMTWSWDDNWTGWNALLDGKAGTGDVSQYAAPARAQYLRGLPPTYIDVGTLDIFAKENEDYASRLREAGVEVEWHLYEGVPHGFEFRGRRSKIVKGAQANRHAAMLSF